MFGFERRRGNRLDELLTKPLDEALRDTGAPLLDTFLCEPIPPGGVARGPFRDRSPLAAAIDDAGPKVRGDLFARAFLLCSRLAAAGIGLDKRERWKVTELLCQFDGKLRASLRSADAAVLLGTDVEAVWEVPAFQRPATYLRQIMSMVEAAKEFRLHITYIRYLTDLADYVDRFHGSNSVLRVHAIPLLIKICGLIDRPLYKSQFLKDARNAKMEADSLVEELRIEAGPILGDYVGDHASQDDPLAGNRGGPSFGATKKAVLDASPELRGTTILAIIRLDRLSQAIRRDIFINRDRPGGRYYGRAFTPLLTLNLQMFHQEPWRGLLGEILKQGVTFTEDEAAELIELHISEAGYAPSINLMLFKSLAASVTGAMPKVVTAVRRMKDAPSQIQANHMKALKILEDGIAPEGATEAVTAPAPWEVLQKVKAAREAVIAAEQNRQAAVSRLGPLEIYPYKRDYARETTVVPYNDSSGGSLANYLLAIWRALRAGVVPEDDLKFLREIGDRRAEFARSRREELAALQDPGPGAILTNPQAEAEYTHVRISKENAERFDHRSAYFLERFAIYEGLPTRQRVVLGRLETFAELTVRGTRPTARWRAEARRIIGDDAAYATSATVAMFNSYVPYEPKQRYGWILGQQTLAETDQLPIIGLVWMSADWPAEDVAKPLTDLALRCFVSVPGHGIKFERLGNACLWTLSNLEGGGGAIALSRIAARVRYPKVKAKIDAALNKAADDAGLSRAELEEMVVPTHGFDQSNTVEIAVGDGAAVIAFEGPAKPVLSWRTGQGKTLKSPSKSMREADGDAVKAAKALVKEATADLGVQLRRIERGYLTGRSHLVADWRNSYVSHVFVGPACRSLIWRAGLADGSTIEGLWRDGRFETVTGEPVDLAEATMSLWHPLHSAPATALAWRDRLEALDIVQPFKQAWREVYAVTDAERATGPYSNRFAGHILRQHQAMALAQLHGWKCRHRFSADIPNDYPTHIALPEKGVYVEYWTEAAGGEENPPITETGTYLYINTDRVAFFSLVPDTEGQAPGAMRGTPLAVEAVDPIAFSEIMRHVDLQVSVASIAMDPTWEDRGLNADHPNQWAATHARGYWSANLDAELSETANIRGQALQRILPKIGLADRATVKGRFLEVQGVRSAYRIHIGSGAVHDQKTNRHLCIVVKERAADVSHLRLPFDGDTTLSLILSKAMLLAADDKITDPVIVSQLRQ